MRRKTHHRLALQELKKPERLVDLAEHQQAKVRELEARSEQELAIAIQQCYPAGNGDLVVIVDQAGAGTDAVDVSITIGYETVTV